MSRNALVVGALVLVAAGVALVFMLGGSSDDKASGTETAKTQSGGESLTGPGPRPTLNGSDPAGAAGPATGSAGQNGQAGQAGQTGGGRAVPVNPNGGGGGAPRNGETVTVTPRTEPRGTTADGVPTGAGKSQDYAIDDVRVRDHRGSGQAPLDIPPNVHSPQGPRINSTLTNDIGKQVREIVQACAKGVSREGRGESPRVEGLIVTTVKANQLGVLSATMQARDVPETTAAMLKACMEPKIVGLTAAAPDQADLDSYSISLRMTLP